MSQLFPAQRLAGHSAPRRGNGRARDNPRAAADRAPVDDLQRLALVEAGQGQARHAAHMPVHAQRIASTQQSMMEIRQRPGNVPAAAQG